MTSCRRIPLVIILVINKSQHVVFRMVTIRYYPILTCEDIDDSLVSSLSLKLYLNSLVYHRNIFGSSSKVFGNLWKSSDISEIFGKCSGTFVWPSGQLFWKIFGNLRKVLGNLRKVIKRAVITDFYIIKRTLHVSSKI